MAIYRLGSAIPVIPASAYVAPGATVIGNVVLGEHASVYPGAVLRADDDTIRIGDNTNVQD
ncbi:MAG TPA: gamma carbonic anhydrase family protein, partial [Casimicrobiaceae bacterium]|nr:gamma carbonic anhydrase family protein [Casimicrobiaceae bacterium]